MANGLKSAEFRAQREARWHELEFLLSKVDREGIRGLTSAELLRMPRLYRSALSSLSVARSISLDANLIAYLEALTTRSYIFIYGPRRTLGMVVRAFFTRDWPRSIRQITSSIGWSFVILVLGWGMGHVLTAANLDWFYSLVGEEIAGGRTPTASTETLRETVFNPDGFENLDLGVFATFLFTHNSKVAMMTFALGFALGVPSILLLFNFGASVGAMTAVFANKGLGMDFFGWLMIHGTTELFAIVIATGAGLSLGKAIAFPGPLRRRDALSEAGLNAGTAMIGVVIMLLVAGLLEGFARQLVQDTAIRFAIGGTILGLWLGYFSFFGRGGGIGRE